MILVDKDIKQYANSNQLIVENFCEENLGGISYDLTIDKIVGLGDGSKTSSKYILNPGEMVFIKTKEMLDIPYNVLGRIAQKNSRMRMGLYVDGPHYHPGHRTYAYLRVQNISSNNIEIVEGDKIAQIIFEELTQSPDRTYDNKDEAFANETVFKGMSTYKAEYKKHIKEIEKVKDNLESKETQIYSNVLTLMGIVSAVFAVITINFEAFKDKQIDIKFILSMNLSLSLLLVVFFGLLYIITNKQSKKGFCILYIILLIVIVGAIVGINFII